MNLLIVGGTSGIGRDFLDRVISKYQVNISIASRSVLNYDSSDDYKSIKIDLCDVSTFSNLKESYDIIVIASGVVHNMLIGILDTHKVQSIITTNLLGQIELIDFLIRNKQVNRGARITFISSIAANFSMKGNSIYSVSKAGLEAFVRCCANEFQRKKILVNSVAPGMVNTKMTLDAKNNLGSQALLIDEKKYPLGYASTDQIIDFIEYLSFSNKYINGQNIIIDGGRTITI
jgi:NAD(P)-dependent dehydrogenase (short-subunit alcohol dehydrogenase family)